MIFHDKELLQSMTVSLPSLLIVALPTTPSIPSPPHPPMLSYALDASAFIDPIMLWVAGLVVFVVLGGLLWRVVGQRVRGKRMAVDTTQVCKSPSKLLAELRSALSGPRDIAKLRAASRLLKELLWHALPQGGPQASEFFSLTAREMQAHLSASQHSLPVALQHQLYEHFSLYERLIYSGSSPVITSSDVSTSSQSVHAKRTAPFTWADFEQQTLVLATQLTAMSPATGSPSS